jgi:hypothetical protein
MKQLKLYTAIILLSVVATLNKAGAQEKVSWKGATYTFECKPEIKGDTLPKLWCVLSLTDLQKYEKLNISYNEKIDQFVTNNILKTKSADYKIENGLVYFRINENLSEPFVVIEGTDKNGKKYTFRLKDARGKTIDPAEEKLKWKKEMARVDSMDYVRRFDNVYIGKDGMPRYKAKDGRVYIIEKSSTRLEN